MDSTTQNIIDDLYVNFKDIFITPAISTNMYKEIEKNRFAKKRQHGRKTWFSNECEVYARNVWLRKTFSHMNTVWIHMNYIIYWLKKYIKCVNKTNKYIQKKFMIK